MARRYYDSGHHKNDFRHICSPVSLSPKEKYVSTSQQTPIDFPAQLLYHEIVKVGVQKDQRKSTFFEIVKSFIVRVDGWWWIVVMLFSIHCVKGISLQ